MTFHETDFQAPTRHNPYLHQKIVTALTALPKGQVLDVPSGPGYLMRDLKALGFNGIAGEIDETLHCFKDLDYLKVDMTQAFPFADSSFDYVTSIEGIEHIENHFFFLREVARILKPGGRLLLTTPNVHTLQSRWNFFISGFHNLAAKPIPLDTENIYFEHINPITFNQLYFYCEKAGLQVEALTTHRLRSGSRLYYLLFYPFIKFGLWRACFGKEKDPARRQQNKRLYKMLASPANQLGSHTIVVARKI